MEKNRRLFISRLKQTLTGKYLSVDELSEQETEFLVWKNQLPEVCRLMLEQRGGRLFTMVGSDERGWTGTLALYYVFAFDKTQQFVTVKTLISEEEPTSYMEDEELDDFDDFDDFEEAEEEPVLTDEEPEPNGEELAGLDEDLGELSDALDIDIDKDLN